MRPQIIRSAEWFVALFTKVGLLSSVSQNMSFQSSSLAEWFVAFCTFVQLLCNRDNRNNRVQQLSQSVCIGVTLSFGWLGKLSREAANRVRFEPRATFELRATSVPGPKGLRGRRPHSNCVSSNCVQQLSQNVCKGVTLFPSNYNHLPTVCVIYPIPTYIFQ